MYIIFMDFFSVYPPANIYETSSKITMVPVKIPDSFKCVYMSVSFH